MQSWLNWYSIGLENRHSERISGFESLALRYALMAELADAPDLSSVVHKERESSTLSGCIICICSQVVKTVDCNSMTVGSTPTICLCSDGEIGRHT